MQITPIKTRKFLPPKDNLFSLIRESFRKIKLRERSLFVFASKIVAIGQGRCLKIGSIEKDRLIKKEADYYLERKEIPNEKVMMTIKNKILIPSSGIDESNGRGYYILWPKNPYQIAKKIYQFIKKQYHLKNFGVIITDSHTMPKRLGTMGVAIAYYGFYPLRDYRDKLDIFGRKLIITLADLADSLAAAAVLVMGEGIEQTPIAIIKDINNIEFRQFNPTKANPIEIEEKNDIYYPMLKAMRWKRGGSLLKFTK